MLTIVKIIKRVVQVILFLIIVPVLFTLYVALLDTSAYLRETFPSPGVHLNDIIPRVERFIFLKDSVQMAIGDRKRYTRIENISPEMKDAILAIEDNRFYDHIGIDPSAIARASLVNLQYGRIEEGASTITQQLAKNLFLSQEQTMGRKIEEFLLSLDLEVRYSKDEILELYLNTIYFGAGFYGIGEASHGYFDKAPAHLDLAEAAMLAGIPNAPSIYSPYVDYMLSKKRQFAVLDAMVRAGFITEREAASAKIESIDFIGSEAIDVPSVRTPIEATISAVE